MDEFIDVKDLVEDILTELRVSDSAKKDDSEDCFSEKEAKDYLREKFSDDVIRTFFEREKQATDAVFVWKRNTKICENCNGSTCGLLKYYRRDETIPFIQLGKDYQGKEQLGIVYSFDRGCRYNPLEGDFGRLFYKSGLVKWQIRQDFDSFETEEEGLIKAKKLALKACTNQSNLILAGQSGVGKTHLAVAIALKTMRQNIK